MHYHLPPQQHCPKSTQFWENSTTQTLRRQRGSRFPFVQIQMSEIQVKWLSHTPLPMPFIIYLFIGSLVCKGGRESIFYWGKHECQGEKLGPQLLKKVCGDGMSLRDCREQGSVSPWIQDTCTGKRLKYQERRRLKIWLRKAVWTCLPEAYICFASFSSCNKCLKISWLLLVDILQEFKEAGIMFDFIKLIRIALKTDTSRL